jgi:hypothetical protein
MIATAKTITPMKIIHQGNPPPPLITPVVDVSSVIVVVNIIELSVEVAVIVAVEVSTADVEVNVM